MSNRFLLLTAWCNLSLSVALAQNRPGPAYFLRHPASPPRLGLGLLFRPLPAQPVVATVPLAVPAGTGLLTEARLRFDLTGNRGFPVYDPYVNLPETYRKYTLPAVVPTAWPVQLLQGFL